MCSCGKQRRSAAGAEGAEVLQEHRIRNAFHFLIIRTFVRERAHISRSQLISQALTARNAGQKDLPSHTHIQTQTHEVPKDIAAK